MQTQRADKDPTPTPPAPPPAGEAAAAPPGTPEPQDLADAPDAQEPQGAQAPPPPQEAQAAVPLDELLRAAFDRFFEVLGNGSQDLGKITEELGRAGRRARAGTEDQIKERPLGAILLFFFLGMLFGRVTRRGA